jgi:hypothetical protein
MTMCGAGRTYLIGGHRERVNVTLLRGVAVYEAELRWIQQFRSHVTDNSWFGCRRTTWLHNGGIGDGTRDSEVPKACITILGDQDVPLDITGIGAWFDGRTPFIAHRIDITVYDT